MTGIAEPTGMTAASGLKPSENSSRFATSWVTIAADARVSSARSIQPSGTDATRRFSVSRGGRNSCTTTITVEPDAPIILTAFGRTTTNANLFTDPQASLSWFVWDLIKVPNETSNERAWAGALLLLIMVLIVFVAARVALARSERKLGRR